LQQGRSDTDIRSWASQKKHYDNKLEQPPVTGQGHPMNTTNKPIPLIAADAESRRDAKLSPIDIKSTVHSSESSSYLNDKSTAQ